MLHNFLENTPYWPKPVAPVCIYCDGQAAIDRVGSMMYNGESRHIRWKHNAVREFLSSGIITINYVKSKYNMSDPLTKGLSREEVERTSKRMGLRPRTSQHGDRGISSISELLKRHNVFLKNLQGTRYSLYDFVFYEGVPNRIVEKYFNGVEFIQKRQLFLAFTEKFWRENNDGDAEKFAILYFLHSFVLSNVDTVVITRLHFDLVDSGRYTDFSWGTLSFDDLTKAGGKFYLIQGMPLVIQVWLYECCSNVPRKIASKINEHPKKKQKVDSSTSSVKKSLRKKPVNIVDEHTQKKTPAFYAAKAVGMKTTVFKPIQIRQQQYEDKYFELQHMDYAGAETSPQRFSLNIDQNLGENQDGTKGCTDLHPNKTNIEIDSQLLIPDELLRRSSAGKIRIFPHKHPFVYHPINGIVDTKIIKKFMDWISVDLLKGHAKRKGSVDHYKKGKSVIPMMHFGVETCEDKNRFYTMGFPNQSWTDSQIDVCFYYLRKKSKYDPNRFYKFSIVHCNFMNIIRSIHDVYSVDDLNLMEGEQKVHLNEYINEFRMHAAVPWHTVEDIYIPVNIKEKHHWVLAVLSFSKRFIFLYDSYEPSGHYPAVFTEIEKLAEIIPLCLQSFDFYDKKGIDL
ncbi:hypothetical protein FXO38_25020 [Capsicum annuum]|nr:hypothetical protein FXO38_25020 [Capsicum annuum]KAF3658883.1 hypothetical protein FXO37_14229 [Capsicum annuum]